MCSKSNHGGGVEGEGGGGGVNKLEPMRLSGIKVEMRLKKFAPASH